MMYSLGLLDLLLWGWVLLVAWAAFKIDEAKTSERTKAEESERFAAKLLGEDQP